jgi:hypothetical protein
MFFYFREINIIFVTAARTLYEITIISFATFVLIGAEFSPDVSIFKR